MITSAIRTCLAVLTVVSTDFANAVAIISYFAISVGYGIVTEWYWRGQTLGKRMLRLRVMDEQGLRLRFNQIVIRNLLRTVDMLPGLYFVGGVAAALQSAGTTAGRPCGEYGGHPVAAGSRSRT